jgi:adenosylmethionine-8-amino-7-oxononanoate aminotransferase
VVETIRDGSGAFQHGHTYLGHPMACAAALAVQRVIRDDNLLDSARQMGELLEQRLTERFGNHHHVGDIRGRGLFRAIEIVSDRASKASFDPALKVHARIKRAALERGLACYPSGGTADGVRGDHVLLAPPYIASAQEIDMIVDRLGAAVDAVIKDVSH